MHRSLTGSSVAVVLLFGYGRKEEITEETVKVNQRSGSSYLSPDEPRPTKKAGAKSTDRQPTDRAREAAIGAVRQANAPNLYGQAVRWERGNRKSHPLYI